MIKRRALLSAVAASVSMMAVGICAAHAQRTDRVRKIVLISDPQASSPQAFQAAQLIAQTWRQLGLDVEIKPMPRQQQSQVVWYERERWDATMWRMVGRPERSDPDELIYNLFHSSTAKSGFNFVGYNNPDYDKIAELQRRTVDQEQRRKLVADAQAMIDRDQPYAFLVHPYNVHAFNKSVWDPATIVTQSGVGIRNFWTFTGASPVSAQKTMVLNARLALVAVNPLYVSGATDSWVTELVWDRLARVGPDGLPRPWAAEKFTAVNETTIEATIRSGMTWHDGKPVTVEDVVFSFEAPMQGDKVPMYRPFVADIAKVEAVGDKVVRFTLKQPNASFITSSLAKINLVPKHIWEPVMKDLAGKTENAEQVRDPSVIGSGSVQAGAGAAERGDCPRPLRRALGGAENGSLDPAHHSEPGSDQRHVAQGRDQLPGRLRRRSGIAGRARQGRAGDPGDARNRYRLRVRGLQQPSAALRRSGVPACLVAGLRSQPDGAGGVERVRGQRQLACLAGAEILARVRGR